MKFSVLNRKVHYWLSLVLALPLLVVVVTGLLLQLKKELPWVQPPEQRGSGREPAVRLDDVLLIARSVPEAEIGTWADIDRVDIRPSRGMLKVVRDALSCGPGGSAVRRGRVSGLRPPSEPRPGAPGRLRPTRCP
jgi:hypothetical protein